MSLPRGALARSRGAARGSWKPCACSRRSPAKPRRPSADATMGGVTDFAARRILRTMFFSSTKKSAMPSPDQALPGRKNAMQVGESHFVNQHRIVAPFPEGMKLAMFGMGCFWGAERKFWQTPGVYATAVGYAGGYTENAT